MNGETRKLIDLDAYRDPRTRPDTMTAGVAFLEAVRDGEDCGGGMTPAFAKKVLFRFQNHPRYEQMISWEDNPILTFHIETGEIY